MRGRRLRQRPGAPLLVDPQQIQWRGGCGTLDSARKAVPEHGGEASDVCFCATLTWAPID